jgi:hypothetical protein
VVGPPIVDNRPVSELPPCGLYRTGKAIGDIPSGRLVYFHNHGEPGPGVYFPERWIGNRAQFSPKGTTLPNQFDTGALEPLPAEGFYRVTSAFHCCAKKCVEFMPDAFVQLGYNGSGKALLFSPELGGESIAIPERGTPVDDAVFPNLARLAVAERKGDPEKPEIRLPRGIIVH